MAEEAAAAPPDDAVSEAAEERASQPEVQKISEVSKRGAKKGRQKVPVGADERVEVDRTALNAILDVSSRIQDIQKKSRLSMSTLALAHESYKDKQVNKLNT